MVIIMVIIWLMRDNNKWLVVKQPLWKIWVKVSWDDEIPNWMESHKNHVPNHKSVLMIYEISRAPGFYVFFGNIDEYWRWKIPKSHELVKIDKMMVDWLVRRVYMTILSKSIQICPIYWWVLQMIQWIGLGEILQESPIENHGKSMVSG